MLLFANDGEYMPHIRITPLEVAASEYPGKLAPEPVEGVDLGSLRIEPFDGRSWELSPNAPYKGIWQDRS